MIRSPIDGVVVSRQYDVGQTVAASFQAPTLFTIAQDLTRMQAEADVDQADIGRIRVGQVARFTVDAYPEEEFRGTITQVRLNATINQNVVTYPVIIEVANPDGRLRPEMTADVTIEVATVRDVLRVANAALRFRPTDVGEPSECDRRDRPLELGGAEASQGPATGGGRGGLPGTAPAGIGRRRPGPRAASDGSPATPSPARSSGRSTSSTPPARRCRRGSGPGSPTAARPRSSGRAQGGRRGRVGLATARVNTTGGRPPMRGF